MITHNGSGFDSYVILNNLCERKTITNLIKNRAGLVSLKVVNEFVDKDRKIPQSVHFRCGRVRINSFSKKIRRNYRLQLLLLNQGTDHDEIYEEIWETKDNEWLPYLQNDVFSTVFSYSIYTKSMDDLTGFGMKSSLTKPSLANKPLDSLRDEKEEPIYTYNDDYIGYFVGKSIKGGRCTALNQYFISSFFDIIYDIISKKKQSFMVIYVKS